MKQLLYGLGFIFLFASCENDINAVRALDPKQLEKETAYNVETILSQTAKVRGVLTAPYMERHLEQPPYTNFPRGLQVVFYNDSLAKESILTAKYGELRENSNDVYLKDSVVFISMKDGQRLDCKDLRWDTKTSQFVTDRFCKLTTPTSVLYGQGFRANQNFTQSEFINAYGTMVPEDSILSLQ